MKTRVVLILLAVVIVTTYLIYSNKSIEKINPEEVTEIDITLVSDTILIKSFYATLDDVKNIVNLYNNSNYRRRVKDEEFYSWITNPQNEKLTGSNFLIIINNEKHFRVHYTSNNNFYVEYYNKRTKRRYLIKQEALKIFLDTKLQNL